MLLSKMISKVWSLLWSAVESIGLWVESLEMSRMTWTIIFALAFLFGVVVCFQGYGSRKNY